MNEIETTELNQIEVEINFYKGQAVQSIFEIGERLIKAKELVGHGEWENWLSEKVDFSSQQANRFMRVRNEFSNPSTLRDLNQSKIFALLSVPQEEREIFIEENPVEDMTTRELRQAIKEKKELEESVEAYKHQQDLLREENKALKNREPKVIEKETKIEVIPEHLKEKLIDLEEDKRELEKLKEAGMSVEEYNKQRLEIDKKISERTKEYESLMGTMRRLEESYDKKNKDLTRQATILNGVKTAVEPLKKFRGRAEQLLEDANELSEITKREILSEVNAGYKVLDFLDQKVNEIKSEVIYYEKK